jgi:hypothetical protein
MPEGMRLIPQHEEAPGGCKERTRVEARSENSWWQGLVTPVSHESKARERLLRRARKAGADTVYITAHRAYRGEHRGEGIVRVELEGRALDCSGV